MQLSTRISRPRNSTIVRAITLATLAALLLTTTPSSATSEIVSDVAPPAPRVEHQPPHRDGYAWAPGYWEWNGHFYRWTSGTWVTERQGHWIPDHWDQLGTQWHYVRGHWEH